MPFRFNPFTDKLDLVDTSSSPTGDVQFLAGDSGGNVPPNGSGVINVLGNPDINIVGTPLTSTLQLTDRVKWTPYVVDSTLTEAPYTTIQSAITAAEAAGGNQLVLVRPGTYTENLTFSTGTVDLLGAVSLGDSGQVIISGIHTPPSSGHLIFRNFRMTSATDILNSAAAGTAGLVFIDCAFAITNGFTFNCPNWTSSGFFECFDIGELSTNNGVVNNTAGAAILFFDCTLGAGTGQTAVLSGTIRMDGVDFQCPINFQTGANLSQIDHCTFLASLAFSGNSTGIISTSRISSGSSAAVTMNSTANINLSDIVIQSTNNPAIAGTGTGQLILNTITFLNNSNISGSVNDHRNVTDVGILHADNISFDDGSTIIDEDGELIIGATGLNPKIATLTAGTGVSITNGPGSITIASTGGGLSWTEVTGTSQSMAVNNGYVANNAGLVTITLPATAVFGSVVAVVGKGAGGWRVAQNAGQQILLGGQSTTAGVGGHIDSSATHDSVFLLCTIANTTWTVLTMQGNIAIT